ncbi:hypothetical protein EXS57_02365 [Candidatus Kaiserbacteria bacterium]|nr:hypothetical protein [Candidatus Kaiserbacteria bacterium]
MRQPKPSRRGKSEWGHKVAVMVPGIVIVAVVVGVLFLTPPKESANAIAIGKLSGDTQVQRCDDCTKITVGEESFPLKKEKGEAKSLRGYLLAKAESHPDSKKVELYNEDKQNRLFDVSFDISGSVLNLDKRDIERGASVKYSDFMFGKLKEYFLSAEGITPGDTIALRLYGPSLKDNACRQTLTIHYGYPQYEARYFYSVRLKDARVDIGKRLPSITTINKGDVTTNDRDVVFAQAEKFFRDGLQNDSVYCHNNTYIDQLFAQIAETDNKRYQSRHFVLLNDGAFMFHKTYVSPSDTTEVTALTKNALPLEDPLCLNTKDTFTALGLDSAGNLSYRGVLTRFFDKILAPCSVDIRTN